MPSHVYKPGPAHAEMNITPLIDVTFLLIIFFMLVNNIIGGELEPMIIPDPQTPQTQEITDDNRLVVNIVPAPGDIAARASNPLLFAGEASAIKVGIEVFAMNELDRVTQTLRDAQAKEPNLQVVLRADAAIYYRDVQPVMMALTRAGIGTVHLAAAMPDAGRETGAP